MVPDRYRLTILMKLSIAISLVLLVALGTLYFLGGREFVATMLEAASGRASTLARSLARASSMHLAEAPDASLSPQARAELDRAIAFAMEEPAVTLVQLVDASGAVIASSAADAGTATLPLLREGRQLRVEDGRTRVRVAAPLKRAGRILGEAQIELDLTATVAAAEARVNREIFTFLVASLLLCILASAVLTDWITRPLKQLSTAARAIETDRSELPLEFSTRDEVGDLASALTRMRRRLSTSERVESTIERYLSEHVLSKVREQPDSIALAGERHDITVLFADIRGFTQIASEIEPERLVAYLNEALPLIASELMAEEGWIDKYMGDAVLACFGVAPPRTDHAQRAVRAALAIQQAVQKRSAALLPRAESTHRLEIGIGIQSGPVVFGSIGYEQRLEYTAIGDPVNVARRLQEMAGPGEILITAGVATQLTQPVNLKPLGRRLLTGRAMPVEVIQVAYP